MNNTCPKCGGQMEHGVATAAGLVWALQGLADESMDSVYWIKGNRCSKCGFLELYANETAPPG